MSRSRSTITSNRTAKRRNRDRGGESLWFGNGIRVHDRLVLFFARTRRGTGTGLGFEHVGWTAVMVENPDDEPSAWRVRSLETPTNLLGVLVGFAGVLRLGEHVYALGSQNPVKSHPIYAARWPAEEVRCGDLSQPEWWAGERFGWIADDLVLTYATNTFEFMEQMTDSLIYYPRFVRLTRCR